MRVPHPFHGLIVEMVGEHTHSLSVSIRLAENYLLAAHNGIRVEYPEVDDTGRAPVEQRLRMPRTGKRERPLVFVNLGSKPST